MDAQRVVITGMGAVSPYGEGCHALLAGLYGEHCALTPFDAHEVKGLACRVSGRVPPMDVRRISRELRRTMSPMSQYATLAAWEALAQAGLSLASPPLPRMGVAVGSTLGSPEALQ
ncbi:MAG: beta-ketoacyl-[acyl-carrier-protein] synthase family protein, partial [Desulfovibrio sp.]|nr:beta-ketoacyl-[acyl-carrier-protein] synthase family protein [Desulfovibrio sp.]